MYCRISIFVFLRKPIDLISFNNNIPDICDSLSLVSSVNPQPQQLKSLEKQISFRSIAIIMTVFAA